MKKFIITLLLLIVATPIFAAEFLQVDVDTKGEITAVGSISFDSYSVSALHATWDDGYVISGMVGYIIKKNVTYTIGPNVAYTEDDGTQVGAKIVVEDYVQFDKQSLYWRTELSSIDLSWGAIVTYYPHYLHGFEVNVGGSTEYDYQMVAYNYKLTETTSLRAGFRLNDSTAFIGISYYSF